MSVGIIQIGQCGNQIGLNIFTNLLEEMKNSSEYISQLIADAYFTISKSCQFQANSLLIDMESKVIDKCFKFSEKNGFQYPKENAIYKQSGSGNNWANGFFHHGPSVEKIFVENFAKFSEKFDYLDSCILINSLAGGTGSGLGSYLAVLMKDYFPEINLLNIAVWPNDSGEVVVNSYNTLLSISENYKVSDLITVINNQEIFDICKNIYKFKKIGFENLNSIISKHIINMMIPPSYNLNTTNLKSKTYRINSFISDIIYALGINPKLKFTQIISTPEIPPENIQFTNDSWNSLAKRGLQMLKTGSNESKIDWSIFSNNTDKIKTNSLIEIYRGRNIENMLDDMNNNMINNGPNLYKGKNNSKFENVNNMNDISIIKKYCNDMNIKEYRYKDEHCINNYDKHLTILANSNLYCSNIKKCLSKAYEMYEYNAFIHQYEKYGLKKADFIDAFSFCEQIISDYN